MVASIPNPALLQLTAERLRALVHRSRATLADCTSCDDSDVVAVACDLRTADDLLDLLADRLADLAIRA